MQPKFSSVSPQELEANPWNTNMMSPENEAKLEVSIDRNGIFRPIIVREVAGSTKLQVIGGEHRWEIARRKGMAEIPIVNLGPISDEQAKEIGIIDNARYGADDTVAFGDLLKSLSTDDIQSFLPYSDDDLSVIFSSSHIALDDLGIDENFEAEAKFESEEPEPPAAKAPKTHTIMRFKVSLKDAERLTALIERTKQSQGLTESDDLTNAGDVLTYLLLGQFAQEEGEEVDIDDLLDEAVG